MTSLLRASALRRRLLALVATSSVFAAANCGGKTDEPESASSSSSSSSSTSSTSSSGGSSSSGTNTPNTPNTPTSSSSTSSSSSSGTTTPVPTCSGGKTKRTCANEGVVRNDIGYGGAETIDAGPPRLAANGCMTRDQVMDGCCNPAVTDPILVNGVCCWDFCAGGCCGRPIRVEGVPLVASVTSNEDWIAELTPARFEATLNPEMRAALVADYTRDALLEHASIASFAVFTLELMAVNAPPDLILLAQEAARDEIEHAKMTFAIASFLAEKTIGPSALPITNVFPKTTLAEIAANTVRDGCIGETIASLIAAAQSEEAADPRIQSTLAKIAEDEARHAELAWRFVRWAIEIGGEDVYEAVRAAFESTSNAPTSNEEIPSDITDESTWRALGRLTRDDYDAIAFDTFTSVIAPAARALCARPSAAATKRREACSSTLHPRV